MPTATTTHRRRRALLLAGAVAIGMPAAANAQATAQKAAEYQRGLSAWLQSFVGETPQLPRGLVTVEADGDHYVFRAPGLVGTPMSAWSFVGKPLDATRWSIGPDTAKKEYAFQMDRRLPDGRTETMDFVGSYANQDSQTVLDTTFATPSTSTSKIDGLTVVGKRPTATETTTLAHAEGNSTVTPTTGDRVTFVQTASMTGYRLTGVAGKEGTPFEVSIGGLKQNTTVTDVSRSAIHVITQTLTHALVVAGATTDGPKPPRGPKAADNLQAISRAVVPLLPMLLRGMTVDQEITDLKADLNPSAETGITRKTSIGIGKAAFGFSGQGTGGTLTVKTSFDVGGLAVTPTPAGLGPAMMPTRLAMKATVTGLPTGATADALNRSIDAGPAALIALLTSGSVTGSIEDVALDVAGGHLTGSMKAAIVGPTVAAGSGQFRLRGIDAVQKTMAANPQTAQAGVLLTFAKGLARTEGADAVWDVQFENNRWMVNGQDVAKMANGGR